MKNSADNFRNCSKGFSLLEIIISLAILAIVAAASASFFLSMSASNLKTTAQREALENARRAMDTITHEIKSAKSIYTPTTTANQLSLETSKYSPSGENDTFIDFFLCGSAVCLKKESQDATALTSDSVQVTNLVFSQISTGANNSIQVSLTVSSGSGDNASSVSLTSTASLRTY